MQGCQVGLVASYANPKMDTKFGQKISLFWVCLYINMSTCIDIWATMTQKFNKNVYPTSKHF